MTNAGVRIARATLALPVAVVTAHTVVRIVRHFVKFPVPEVLADLIDNPLRRRVQPPDLLAQRHGVRTGMTVLDVGRIVLGMTLRSCPWTVGSAARTARCCSQRCSSTGS